MYFLCEVPIRFKVRVYSDQFIIRIHPGEPASSQTVGVDPQTSSQGVPLTTGDSSTSSQDNDRVSPSGNVISSYETLQSCVFSVHCLRAFIFKFIHVTLDCMCILLGSSYHSIFFHEISCVGCTGEGLGTSLLNF